MAKSRPRIPLTRRAAEMALLVYRARALGMLPATIEEIVYASSVKPEEFKPQANYLVSQGIIEQRGGNVLRYGLSNKTRANVEVTPEQSGQPVGALVALLPSMKGGVVVRVGTAFDLYAKGAELARLVPDKPPKDDDASQSEMVGGEVVETSAAEVTGESLFKAHYPFPYEADHQLPITREQQERALDEARRCKALFKAAAEMADKMEQRLIRHKARLEAGERARTEAATEKEDKAVVVELTRDEIRAALAIYHELPAGRCKLLGIWESARRLGLDRESYQELEASLHVKKIFRKPKGRSGASERYRTSFQWLAESDKRHTVIAEGRRRYRFDVGKVYDLEVVFAALYPSK